MLKKSVAVLITVIFLFFIQGILHVEVSIIALGGAAILLVITRVHVEKVLHEVDWSTLIFFTGLFIIVGVAQQAGMIKLLSFAAYWYNCRRSMAYIYYGNMVICNCKCIC